MIMDLLFNGKIFPCESVVSQSYDYIKASEDVIRLSADLSSRLSDQDKKLLSDILDNALIIQGCQEEEHFRYAFSLGMLLMHEICNMRYFKTDE